MQNGRWAEVGNEKSVFCTEKGMLAQDQMGLWFGTVFNKTHMPSVKSAF